MRLPVVVIGGGLTAIDTATESLAYYPVQVEKFLARYETLVGRARRGRRARELDARTTRQSPTSSSPMPRAIRAERAAAQRDGRRSRDIAELLRVTGAASRSPIAAA